MRNLDKTDLEILQLLMADARRPYSDIADIVDLSAPAVSDRIARMQDLGVIRKFTVDIDRSQLRGGVSALIDIQTHPRVIDTVYTNLLAADGVEHVYQTADAHVLAHAQLQTRAIHEWLADALDPEHIWKYDVQLLTATEWTASLSDLGFALTCAECGKNVTSDGITARLDEDVYHFCCPLCEEQFTDRHEDIQAARES
jgi:Lrp/AsnC family leucine-responsive transcriptional regulator